MAASAGPCSTCGRIHQGVCKGKREANLIGKTLGGKYEIQSILGSGGNGVVYQASDPVFRRTVAIKVPSRSERQVNLPTFERFSREARAVAAVSHPNVAAIYDAGAQSDGTPFVVMELLVGETLSNRLTGGRMATADAIAMMIQLLAGLGAAHARRIVHRDMKPSNVFLTSLPGYPTLAKILDFGMCKFLEEEEDEGTHLTAPGVILGTPAYMAPEQVMGTRGIDERTDLFACGAILFEALTATRAFPATRTSEVMKQVAACKPVAPSSIVPQLSKEVDRVILRALARDPAARYPTAAAFSVALQTLRTTPNVSAPEAPKQAPAEKLASLRRQFSELAKEYRTDHDPRNTPPSARAVEISVTFEPEPPTEPDPRDSWSEEHTPIVRFPK